jgi:hypothetical protein
MFGENVLLVRILSMANFDMITPTVIVIKENNDPIRSSDNLVTQKTRPAYGDASVLRRVVCHPVGNIRRRVRWRYGAQAGHSTT